MKRIGIVNRGESARRLIRAVRDHVAETGDDLQVFQAGTAQRGDALVTAGGRVLSVCARGQTLEAAREAAYAAARTIRFEKRHYRRDIGARGEA